MSAEDIFWGAVLVVSLWCTAAVVVALFIRTVLFFLDDL